MTIEFGSEFLTRLEFERWLKDKYKNEEITCNRHRYKKPGYTPMQYAGIFKRIGIVTVWDSVGGIAEEIGMYCPVKGGQVYYLVEG